jgi:hypothetical protein
MAFAATEEMQDATINNRNAELEIFCSGVWNTTRRRGCKLIEMSKSINPWE